MVKHLWLDLEDTVITPVVNGWANAELINIQKIAAFISEFKPQSLHLFSFAIWNLRELQGFNDGPRTAIERALGMKFSSTWTVDDDIVPQCCAAQGLVADEVGFSDLSDFWGKQQSFRLCMRQHFKNTHEHGVDTEIVLLDDVVFNEEFHWPDLKIHGRILNIDQLVVCCKTSTNSSGPH